MDLDGLQLLLDAVKQLDQKPFELPTATASQIPSACCFEEVKSTPAGGCSPSRSVQDDPENQNNCSRHDNHERPSANDMRDESQSEDIHINDSRNETAAISFSLFACLPQRLASTPMYGRSDPQMEFSNPMDLSIASTMTADEGPLDLSIGPHVTDHSVEAIDLVLPRIPEKSLSPAIPLDLRSAKSSLPDPTSDLQCKYSRLQESQASTKQVGIADAAKMSKISPLKRKPIETEVDSSTKKKSEKSQDGSLQKLSTHQQIDDCPRGSVSHLAVSSNKESEGKPSMALNTGSVSPSKDVAEYFEDEPQEGDPTLLNELTIFEYFEEFQNIDTENEYSDIENNEDCVDRNPNRQNESAETLTQSVKDLSPNLDVTGAEAMELEDQEQRQKKINLRTKNKELKEKGLSYTRADGTVVPARQIKPPCECRLKCAEKYNDAVRLELLQNLLRLKLSGQNQFLASHMTVVNTARPQVVNSRRQYSRRYWLPGVNGSVKVCKLMPA